MDKLVIVFLGICGALLSGAAFESWMLGVAIGFVLAFLFYYLIDMMR